MSTQALLAAIEADGKEKLARLEQETRLQVARIEATARAAAEVAQREAHQRELQTIRVERSRRLYEVRLQALRTLQLARQAATNAVRAEIEVQLASLRNDSEYPTLLGFLLQEAILLLGDQELAGSDGADSSLPILEIDAQDEKLIQEIVTKLDTPFHIVPNLHGWGGVRVSSADGRIVVDNTLEARLNRLLPTLYQLVQEEISDE